MDLPDDSEWDVVIVGSGAGGGTLAARLVEGGLSVCVLEAGGDPPSEAGDRMPDDYEVPGFHAFACEHPLSSWNFHVRHYADTTRQARDWKYQPGLGVLYPRAGALGGCTTHNAMIFMLPHDADWDHIAALTGDDSWSAKAMRPLARRVEACHHRPLWRWLSRLGVDPTGHGWDGWLRVEGALPPEALGDRALRLTVALTGRGVLRGLKNPVAGFFRWLRGAADPNARPVGGGSFTGVCYTPMSTRAHRRTGARERLLEAAQAHPGRLHIELDALATRVLIDRDGRAEGIEYLKGRHLYRAHPSPGTEPGVRRRVRARREVVLAGGAFNTPQLLMLSGIGPRAELEALGIEVRVDLPEVGTNLQDRYEIGVTHRLTRPWTMRSGATFERGDPPWQRWAEGRCGLYATNGAAVGVVRRSTPEQPEPDIFCMALPASFEGYYPGFSRQIRERDDRLTWAILKAHTRNRGGRVRLRSADPRDPPLIDFHYFEEGTDTAGEDLDAVVRAIEFVRTLTAPLVKLGVVAEELRPGAQVTDRQALADYVRDTAWGHHASCSCPIGPVLDSRLRVRGVHGLRVADASVFPRIPGFFIVSAVYIVGEKAAQLILDDG